MSETIEIPRLPLVVRPSLLAGLPGRAAIPIRQQNTWGEDLPDLVRALAPHVPAITFED
ncbi:hypothetical protein [Caulobacter hibisci]|uniref:Uncharacterized protein n=1 Tax=Caulobacter hibisci TaxID=2035993 RepID=A0ABS0T343_9CAUL|nr:hypothetical protein [Caulobacter hibisci]MBI1685906.1 hypothetical protein [Caulobacter hibisci]